jgi:DNA-binding MurR/RpiR family transcriptional regulator
MQQIAEGLFERLNRLYPRMSKGQKRLADYVTDHYDKAAFMTAAELGDQAEVSESTTVRFATLLGYSGFPEFHQTLEELVRNRLNSIQRMEVTYGRIPEAKILDTVLASDIEKIKLTQEHMDRGAFQLAVDTLLKAKTIYVMGLRSCAPLAAFLSYYLKEIFDDVRLVNSTGSSEVFEQLVRIGENDVIIGISFPRYSMRTLKAMEFANSRNAKVITLTDSIHSPMNLYSSCNLIARSDMASIVDSLVAPLSVINALIVALAMKRQNEVIYTLKTLEKIWSDYQVYSGDEIDRVDDQDGLKLRDPDEGHAENGTGYKR